MYLWVVKLVKLPFDIILLVVVSFSCNGYMNIESHNCRVVVGNENYHTYSVQEVGIACMNDNNYTVDLLATSFPPNNNFCL